MKVRVERDVLTDAVTWTARSLPSRPPVPVLAGLLLDATEDGTLVLSAFDYEVSARVEIPADVLEPGRALVSGKLLAEICRNLPDKPVDLHQESSRVEITCGASRFALGAMPVEDYPALPKLPEEIGRISAADFAEAVNQVSIAASREESVPILTGVRIRVAGDGLTLLATDRYRLGMREVGWNAGSPEVDSAALVRARTLTAVARTLGSGGDIVLSLSTDGTRDLIGFAANGREVTSLLLDGDYPVDRVQALFPAQSAAYAVVDRAALVEALRRVSLVIEGNTAVHLSFTAEQVSLEAGQGDDAQATEALPCTLSGEDITIAFNPHFLTDGLNAVSDPFVRLSFTLPTKPAVLTGQAEAEGDPDDAYRYLVMPVRIGA
ncbi:MAG: DNA polymerase III subunit beta [Actinomycetales bacterium]